MMRGTNRTAWLIAITAGCALGHTVAAQTVGVSPSPTAGATASRVNPHRATLQKLQRRVTIEFSDQRLEDVITFFKEFTGADIEPVWTDDRREGLDKDAAITMNINDLPALVAIEKILAKLDTDLSQHTWQMTEDGALEIGPKDRMNRTKRVEIYDINDLLTVLPRYAEVPELDLDSVLQQGEGGQGQSPFTDGDQQEEEPQLTKPERAEQIVELITGIVETEQWTDNGGDGGSIRYYNGTLIVNAPDYMHRQINGYNWWPSYTAKQVSGRRYVSLNMDTGTSTVDGFAKQPVTGVVGGGGGDGGGGGGGRR
jgi:hypothetical protein